MTNPIVRTAYRKARAITTKSSISWRWVHNFGPTVKHMMARPELSPEARRVVADLNRDGIAVSSVEALLGPDSLYNEMVAAVDELQNELSEEIEEARSQIEGPRKSYVYNFLGHRPDLDHNSIFARFALQDQILGIANTYYGMHTKLVYYNVWRNFMTDAPPREAQLWHLDPDDRFVLKFFVNLVDVDENRGAFVYGKGTHPKGHDQVRPEVIPDGQGLSDDSQMADALPTDKWLTCPGPKGTMIFADVKGYHKGGYARDRDRTVYTGMFTSQLGPSFLQHPNQIPASGDADRDFALGADK